MIYIHNFYRIFIDRWTGKPLYPLITLCPVNIFIMCSILFIYLWIEKCWFVCMYIILSMWVLLFPFFLLWFKIVFPLLLTLPRRSHAFWNISTNRKNKALFSFSSNCGLLLLLMRNSITNSALFTENKRKIILKFTIFPSH